MKENRLTYADGAAIEPVSVSHFSFTAMLAAMWKFFARIPSILYLWHERARQRRHLMELDDHLLKDIGLTRGDVYRESHRPFWKP